ncbi:MAG: HAAS signaling domain-containing protein [Lachnospiraceae bacterium]
MSQNTQNELIERYLYDVTRRLPEKQKKDIEEELRTLVEDMLAEYEGNGKEESENIKEVLEKLGDPAKLALKYRDGQDHLIGGTYYPVYCQILKIVLLCVTVGMAVSAVISFFVTAGNNGINTVDAVVETVENGFINIAAIPGALLEAFACVTLVFFLLERNQVRLQGTENVWKITSLPPVPVKKAVISRGDSIAGLVFSVLVIVLLVCAPEFAGAWVKDGNGNMVAISIFNLSVWNRILPLLIISFACGIVDDFVKLIAGCYNLTVMYVSIFCTVVGIIVTVYMFKTYEIFNPDFVEEVSALTGKTFHAQGDIMVYWNTGIGGMALSDIFMGIICLIMSIDLAVTVYRTLRYGYRGNQ